MRTWITRAFLFAALAGCGGESAVDAGAALDATTGTDAAVEVGEDVSCALTPPAATLPMVDGGVRIEGGDAGVTPTASGGDPSGRWVIDDATLWLPSQAAGLVDVSMSWIRGTGWATLEGGRYALSLDMGFRVEAVVGGLTRGIVLGATGRYELRGTELVLTAECMSTPAAQGSITGFRVSRDAPERGRLFIELSGMAGRSTLIFQLQRVP